jgi:hypothetical protein
MQRTPPGHHTSPCPCSSMSLLLTTEYSCVECTAVLAPVIIIPLKYWCRVSCSQAVNSELRSK